MNALEEQADNAKARELYWKPLSWLGTLRPTTANDAWDQPLWETFVCTTLGLEVPLSTNITTNITNVEFPLAVLAPLPQPTRARPVRL